MVKDVYEYSSYGTGDYILEDNNKKINETDLINELSNINSVFILYKYITKLQFTKRTNERKNSFVLFIILKNIFVKT